MIGMTVCSGIGAPELAAPWVEWRYQSEIEPFPSAVLAERFPDAVNLGDMTKFQEWPDAAIDVLVGGTPCQSFSVAGLRKGLDDPRGNLMLTFLAIARKYRPRWIIWENVPGVLSSNGGRDFGTFLAGLGQCGYGWAYRVLDAQYVRTPRFPHAVPQRRRRVFVVGYLGDWTRAAAVLFEREGLQGHPAPRREAGQGVAGSVVTRTCRSVGADDAANGNLIRAWPADVAATLNTAYADKMGLEDQHALNGASHFVPAHTNDTFGTLTTRSMVALGARDIEDGAVIPCVSHALRGEGFDASEDGTGRGTPLVPVAFRTTGNNGVYEDGDVVSALTTQTDPNGGRGGMGVGAIAQPYSIMPMNSGKDFKARETDVAQPLMAGGPVGGNQGGDYIAQPMDVRRLTPVECERLMGFSDNFTQIPWRGKPADQCPDGPRYKACGNSWAVNCGEFIFDRIKAVEEMATE